MADLYLCSSAHQEENPKQRSAFDLVLERVLSVEVVRGF